MDDLVSNVKISLTRVDFGNLEIVVFLLLYFCNILLFCFAYFFVLSTGNQ